MTNYTDKNGLKQGLWEEYNGRGFIQTIENYRNGKLHGIYEEYWSFEPFLIKKRIDYVDGKINGLYQYFYSNGNIFIESNEKDGQNNGLYIENTTCGKVKFSALYFRTQPVNFHYNILTGNIIIGCIEHSIEYWLENYKAIANKEGISDEYAEKFKIQIINYIEKINI